MDTTNNNKMINVEYLENNIKTLEEKLPAILDDFKKYYIFYNKTPTYNEYQTIFENLKSNLDSINSELFDISTKVENSSQFISDQLMKMNILIEKEKSKNTTLKSNTHDLNNKYHGSKEMINEYKQIYNNKYLRNISLFVGIFIGVLLLYIFFSKPSTKTSIAPSSIQPSLPPQNRS
jgi:tetrahydromethanopterin S-methyltransferase subunit G